MGGLGTLAMAIREPNLFSAVIPICGGADMKNIQRLDNLPIWLFHGDRDDVIPLDNSILIYQALRSRNDHVLLTVYGDVYHDSWSQTYEDEAIYEWLLKYER
jgi:predicted peptidase